MLARRAATRSASGPAIGRRLRPLMVGVGLQNLLLWVPVEKIFMTQIGFTATSIGVVAAVYSAVVPVLEVPFGILADRWSRRGALILSTLALALSSLVGGLSDGPATYAAAAVLLGVFFALSSGTADSIVYDTLIEETGSSDGYERWIGRLHVVEAVALVVSAVLGGLLAAITSPRLTYFATVPLVMSSIVALLRCREPRLHRATEPTSFRRQAALTVRALTSRPELRRIIALAALCAMAAQVVFEFGPLWLVAEKAPSGWYGPYWAAVVSTVGVGGWLASRVDFTRRATLAALVAIPLVAAVALVGPTPLPVIIGLQFLIGVSASLIGVRAGYLLHEGVPAHVRAGVSSGASTVAWVAFVPLSVGFGWLSHAAGVHVAAWLLVAITLALGVLLRRVLQPLPAPMRPAN